MIGMYKVVCICIWLSTSKLTNNVCVLSGTATTMHGACGVRSPLDRQYINYNHVSLQDLFSCFSSVWFDWLPFFYNMCKRSMTVSHTSFAPLVGLGIKEVSNGREMNFRLQHDFTFILELIQKELIGQLQYFTNWVHIDWILIYPTTVQQIWNFCTISHFGISKAGCEQDPEAIQEDWSRLWSWHGSNPRWWTWVTLVNKYVIRRWWRWRQKIFIVQKWQICCFTSWKLNQCEFWYNLLRQGARVRHKRIVDDCRKNWENPRNNRHLQEPQSSEQHISNLIVKELLNDPGGGRGHRSCQRHHPDRTWKRKLVS